MEILQLVIKYIFFIFLFGPLVFFVLILPSYTLFKNLKDSYKNKKLQISNDLLTVFYFIGLFSLVAYAGIEDKYLENSLYFFGTIFFSYALIKTVEKQSVYIKDYTKYLSVTFFVLAPITSLIISILVIGSLDLSSGYIFILAFFILCLTYISCLSSDNIKNNKI